MPNERQPARQARQYGRWQAFVFGLPLALLELGIVAVFNTYYEILTPVLAITLGLLLYVVIAVLAGYWFCRRGARQGIWAGLRAGLVGAGAFLLVMTLVFAGLWIKFVTTPLPPHASGLHDPMLALTGLATGLGLFVLLNAAGVLLSALGGWLGGILAGRRAEPRGQVSEQQA